MHPILPGLEGLGIGGKDHGEVARDEEAIGPGMIGTSFLEGAYARNDIFEIPVLIFIVDRLLVEGRGGCGPCRILDPDPIGGEDGSAEQSEEHGDV